MRLWRRKWTKEGNSTAIEITEKLKELNVDKYVIENLEVWNIHQNILLGHSENPEADKARMLELSDNLVSKRGRDDDYLIRAIIEMDHFEGNCQYAADLLSRIADPSADTNNFIASGADANIIRDEAIKAGMRTLRQDALEKLKAGITTPEEVVRVTRAL